MAPGRFAQPIEARAARTSGTALLASAPSSVQFGELKAPPEAVGAERAEDSGLEAAQWVRRGVDKVGRFGNRSGIVPLAGAFIYFFKHDSLEV